jgi:hypothetical protein
MTGTITDAFIEQQGPSEADLAVVRALLYKLRHNLTAAAFDEGRFALTMGQSPSVPPLRNCHRRLSELAGFDSIKFDCCINSCVCYAPEVYRDLEACPFCKEPRYNRRKEPRKQCSMLPLIPILLALVQAQQKLQEMKYHSQFCPKPEGMTDIFDGEKYKKMKSTHVSIDGHPLPHKFFSDSRDIALGLATDGFSPFKKRRVTAWPIVLINYNLPPHLRFRRENLICIGCVPGPKKPKDFDSYLWYFIMEMLRLAVGVKAFDGENQFML